MNSPKEEVNISIDKNHVKSPNPTTGSALYLLGKIVSDYDLFREVHGHGDDELISNNAATITLKDGEKFYSAQRSLNPGRPDARRRS